MGGDVEVRMRMRNERRAVGAVVAVVAVVVVVKDR